MGDPRDLDEVQSFYGDYPFPSRAWRQLQRLQWLPARLRPLLMKTDYQRRVIRAIRSHVTAPARILDAGCGTGELTISLARAFPEAHLLGIDFNARSLDRARSVADALGRERIQYEVQDLSQPLSIPGGFDLIVCIGVLHHMKAPEFALRQLVERLSEKGEIFIWLYGELGRSIQRAGLELLDLLVSDSGDVATKVDLAGRLGLIPLPRGRFLHRLGRRLRGLHPHWEGAAFVADTYAHPCVREYHVASVLELLDSADLELVAFLGQMRSRPEDLWSDPEVLRRMKELPREKMLRAIELAVRPNNYQLIARRRRS